jgi:cell wall-associated NlpC family hydrolase
MNDLNLPNPACLLGCILAGILGYVAFKRGRKAERAELDKPHHAGLVFALVVVSMLTIAGCSTVPRDGASTKAFPSRLSADQANEVTLMAIGLVGTPYRYGGNTPTTGFDCSGLIGYVYKERAGVPAPRSVSALVSWGQSIPADAVRTGDLAIFIRGNSATHAGIYVGEGRFVHAPAAGGEVRLDQLKSKYWSTQQVAFRRP